MVMGITTKALIRGGGPGEIKTSMAASHQRHPPPTPMPKDSQILQWLSSSHIHRFKQVALGECGPMCLV